MTASHAHKQAVIIYSNLEMDLLDPGAARKQLEELNNTSGLCFKCDLVYLDKVRTAGRAKRVHDKMSEEEEEYEESYEDSGC